MILEDYERLLAKKTTTLGMIHKHTNLFPNAVLCYYEQYEPDTHNIELFTQTIENHPNPSDLKVLILVMSDAVSTVQVTQIASELKLDQFKVGNVDFIVTDDYDELYAKVKAWTERQFDSTTTTTRSCSVQ